MSTLCFLGIEILEAVKGRGLFFIELEVLVARVVILLPGGVGVGFVLGGLVPEGRIRGVVVVFGILVLLGVRVVVHYLRLIFGDVGATGKTLGFPFSVALGVALVPSTMAVVTTVLKGTAT